jgi:hypothetical protein
MSDAEIAANIDDIDGADLIQQFEDSKKIGKRARISDFVSELIHRDSKTVMANEVTATAPKGSPVDLSDLSDAEIAVMCDEIGDLEDFEATKKIGKRARVKTWMKGLMNRDTKKDSKTVIANEVTATAPRGSPVDLRDLSDAEIAVMCDEIGDLEDFEATKMGSVATPARQAETAEPTREPITITIGEQDDVFDGACI